MKYLYTIILSGMVLFLFSCKKDDPDPNFGQAYFLKVGHEWVYEYEDLFTFETGTLKVKVERNPRGGIYVVSKRWDSDPKDISYWYVDADTRYLMVYEAGEKIGDADPIYRVKNTYLNDRWQGKSSKGTFFTYTVRALDETVNVPYGTVEHCREVEVEFSNSFFSQYNYWNDSIGEVMVDNIGLVYELSSKNF